MSQMTSGLFDHMNEDRAQGDLAADVPGSIIELEEHSALAGFVSRRGIFGEVTLDGVCTRDGELPIRILFAVPERQI